MLQRHPHLKSVLVSFFRTVVVFYAIIFCFFSLAAVFGSLASSVSDVELPAQTEHHFGKQQAENKLLSIPITGLILGDPTELDGWASLLSEAGVTYGYEIKDQLYAAAQDDTYDGVIIEINSPGGTIYGSQAISDGMNHYRQTTGKPVVVYIAGLAASGGYWAAAAGDYIVADYGTGIGSIGVISGPFKFYDEVISEDGGILGGGVVTQKGIQNFYISAGESKDLGNPFRKMTDEELNSLQTMVNNQYGLFVSHVATSRSIPEDVVTSQIKALVYDPITAQELKLIDQMASREVAYQTAAKRASIEGDNFEVVREIKPLSTVEELLSVQTLLKPAVQLGVISAKSDTLARSCGLLTGQILAFHGDLLSLCH